MATPLGPIHLEFSSTGLKRLVLGGKDDLSRRDSIKSAPETSSLPEETLHRWRTRLAQALERYFAGQPASFEDLPLDLEGSPFHLQVWGELRKIPLGETVSYQELARRLGKPRAARAVGQACGANPIPLIIPCHRVIAADGALGGYSAGLERKRWLLQHEKAFRREQ
uniref:Methylated-DNA--protein-cysteine methyltransferase n=1 Tax=Desulfobacca acetoxidans TaxID=60893 RepID=A0A7V6A0W9_9BACT